MVARHREELDERFVLDHVDPVAQLAMLNKRGTYEIATRVEVSAPGYWLVRGMWLPTRASSGPTADACGL